MTNPFLAQPVQAGKKPAALSQPDDVRSQLQSCKALIIDTNQTSRSLLRAMMADLGLQHIVQAAKISDARKAMENHTFDVVLCDYHFDDAKMSGSDLLDELRRANLLPYSTVFIMITGEASYVKVAEAAESALDSYLLKPHTVNQLEQRLLMARHRKTVLANIFEAIEKEDFELAARLCLERFAARAEYWVYAARIGGELLLRLERHEEAKKLFLAVDETKALPWARLGIARAQLDSGHAMPAKRTLESLMYDHPTFADAYDVMGRAHLQSGDFDEAYEVYQRAMEVTPSSLSRLQKVGTLAFYLGRNEEAAASLDRAVSLGVTSKMFDYQSLIMLALIRFQEKDSKGLQRCYSNLQFAQEKQPNSQRLKRMCALVYVLNQMLNRQVAEVVRLVKAMVPDFSSPDFDFEAAGNVLALITCLSKSELELPDAELWVQQLAKRFCVSKPTSDLLVMTVAGHDAYADIVKQSYKFIVESAESAMTHARDGTPGTAVKALLVHGSKTQNAKLLDLANMVLQRYRDQINDADMLSEMVQDMRSKFCRSGPHVQLGASGGREAGGIQLRSGHAANAQPAATQST